MKVPANANPRKLARATNISVHRKGKHRAAVAVAHSIMIIAYYLITRGEDYKDLGSNYFEKRQQETQLLKNSISCA
jgi:hypothetical protein